MSNPQAYDEGWNDGRDHWKGVLEPQIAELRKAIQQYLDCQTSNQWVDHFRKALKGRHND